MFKIKEGKLIVAILIMGGFITMLNETSLAIAFPQIMTEFGISAGLVQWLTTIYVLISGIVFLMTAYLLKKYTVRKLYLISMLLLVIGSVISIFSVNFPLLMSARIIQAIGTGIIVPLVFNSVLYLTLPQKRGFMMGIVSLVIFAAPIFSPVLMGFIMEITDWHYYFILMLIFFVVATIFGYFKLTNFTETGKAKLDILSVIFAAIGCSGIVYAFSSISESSLTVVIASLLIGIIALALFIHRQKHIDHPLLRVQVLKDHLFIIGVLANMLNVMAVFAIVVVVPMYLETALHTSSLTASLIMFPGTLINCVIPLLSGHIYDEHGPRIVICTGLGIMAVGIFCLTTLSLTTSFLIVGVIGCIIYFGSGLALAPNQTNTLGNLKKEYYSSGSAIMTSTQQIGGAIGSSLFISLMTIGQNNYLNEIINPTEIQKITGLVHGVDFSFTVAAILITAIFVLSFLLKQNEDYDES